jgi:hypothetical protein
MTTLTGSNQPIPATLSLLQFTTQRFAGSSREAFVPPALPVLPPFF